MRQQSTFHGNPGRQTSPSARQYQPFVHVELFDHRIVFGGWS
jgi:hypothetical protein